jgi:hypothetical protein
MKIKELAAKVLKGEALTDEERLFLEKYDDDAINKQINDKIASEKHKAESKAGAAIEELNAKIAEISQELEQAKAGGSETEKLKRELEKTAKKAAELEAKAIAKDSEIRNLVRKHALSGIRGRVQIVDGVNPAFVDLALESAFKDIEDLSDEDGVAKALDQFKAENPRLIAAGGAGTGTPAKGASGQVGANGAKTPDKMTAQEREKELKTRKII